MFRRRLGTIRGQLVLWYLSVLAVLLLVLGISQSLILAQYLRSTTSTSMRQSAYTELRFLGPCLIRTPADLNLDAQQLALLLGSQDIAVKVVTASGVSLADHGFGFPGHSHPLNLPASTIQTLIRSARLPARARAHTTDSDCQGAASTPPATPHSRPAEIDHPTVTQGDLVLVAIPLGPDGHSVGYAILGRSLASANATTRRTEIVFALGALIALVLAAAVALPLINRALRPLRRIARTAGAIAAGDMQARANLANSPDEIGRLGGAFDTMVDRLETALTSANASEERMRQFLADASHELRTPLTVLRGTSEVLLRQGANQRPEIEAPLRDMHEEAVRLSKLVDDLLTLTRLDAGQPLNPELVPVRPFLEHFTERYCSAWPNRTVDLDLDSLDGATAYVDRDALQRVVTNLIDNAARYSTTGTPITVAGSEHKDTVTVSVRDEGPGLSQEDAARVFERFYRGARSRARASGGTGLGLAIVQALVRQSGGQVHIETGPDRGTAVSIELPRAPHVASPADVDPKM